MTIEASLRIKLGQQTYILQVKMIKIDSASYFFIRDKEKEDPLLNGAVLELTYTGSFSLTEFSGVVKSSGIPGEVVIAIQNELLKNEQLWF